MFECSDFSISREWRQLKKSNATCNYIRSLTLFWVLLIFCIGPWTAFWYMLWYNGLIVTQDGYNVAFTEYGLILYLFFSEYVRRSWVSYTAGPDMYFKFMNRAVSLGSNIYASVYFLDSGMDGEKKENSLKLLKEIKREIDVVMYHMTVILMPHREAFHPVDVEKGYIKKPKTLESQKVIMAKRGTLSGPRISEFNIKYWVFQLEGSGCIRAGAVHAINTNMEKISGMLEELESSSKVTDLDQIYKHTIAVIVIYFALILPYKLVVTTGAMVFAFYPFLIFALAGVIFIRKYIGSPFREIKREYDTSMDDWYGECRRKNRAYYNLLKERLELGEQDEAVTRVAGEASKSKRGKEFEIKDTSFSGAWVRDEATVHFMNMHEGMH